MKLKLAFVSALIGMASMAQAATYVVSNIGSGYASSDALFQNVNGSLLVGGIVALGHFNTNAAPSGDLSLIATTIANFTILASSTLAGGYSDTYLASVPGIVEAPAVNGAQITTGNVLLDRGLYVFVGNASTLADSTSWALAQVNTLKNDVPFNNTYSANPFGVAPVIGSIGSATSTDLGGTSATFTTLQMEAIPEPSSVLLGTLGVLGLLRRRRI
jgi:hypothetical protein